MKKIALTVFFSLMINVLTAQSVIQFEHDIVEVGQLVEGQNFAKEIPVKNIGTDSLVIQYARSGGGGAMGNAPRKPIPPGGTGIVQFTYHTAGRLGVFQKRIDLISKGMIIGGFSVKGEVVRPRTTIAIDRREKNVRALAFGEVDSVTVEITNTGAERLYIGWIDAPQDVDIIRVKTHSTDDSLKKDIYELNVVASSNKKIKITVWVKNVYGNVGPFERKLFFKSNVEHPGTHDTLVLTLKGKYQGAPLQKKIFEGGDVFFYDQDKLIKRAFYTEKRILQREDFYEGTYCVRSLQYYSEYSQKKGVEMESFYKKGKLIRYLWNGY